MFLHRKHGLRKVRSVNLKVSNKLNERVQRKTREFQRTQKESIFSNIEVKEDMEEVDFLLMFQMTMMMRLNQVHQE